MATAKLTQTFINNLPVPEKGYWINDEAMPGLRLYVGASGSKTYYISYKNVKGKKDSYKIGDEKLFTPIQAREAAKKILAEMAVVGTDIKQKRKRDERITLRALCDAYLAAGGSKFTAAMAQNFPDCLDRAAEEITPLEIAAWRVKEKERTGNKDKSLNHKVTALKTILNFGVANDIIEANPLAKLKKLKEMALPNFISGIFGVTEPAIYGILLPLKKPFIISCIAGGIGGAFYGHFNFRKFILGGMGIFELPNMMNPDGSMGNIIVALVGIAISMAVGFILTMVFYRDPETAGEDSAPAGIEAEKTVKTKNIVITSPVKGKVMALSEVQDEAFSTGILGQGAAILPEDDTIYAPADGKIDNMFSTGHAIGLLTDSGAEVLIHVGMDTVQLNGKGFQPLVKTGDTVKKGQVLLKFDRNLIQEAGYSLVTPVIITNTDDYAAVLATDTKTVNAGDSLLTLS